MNSSILFARIAATCLLAAGLAGAATAANAGSAGQSVLKSGNNVSNSVVEISSRGRGQRIYTPIAPSYLYYDYPYYYSRGYYPTHIRPGFIYYGYPYSYYQSRYYRKYRARAR